eukprot:scaffold722_cov230-Pinguiococcus_pyrenoidosus.AAC.1
MPIPDRPSRRPKNFSGIGLAVPIFPRCVSVRKPISRNSFPMNSPFKFRSTRSPFERGTGGATTLCSDSPPWAHCRPPQTRARWAEHAYHLPDASLPRPRVAQGVSPDAVYLSRESVPVKAEVRRLLLRYPSASEVAVRAYLLAPAPARSQREQYEHERTDPRRAAALGLRARLSLLRFAAGREAPPRTPAVASSAAAPRKAPSLLPRCAPHESGLLAKAQTQNLKACASLHGVSRVRDHPSRTLTSALRVAEERERACQRGATAPSS